MAASHRDSAATGAVLSRAALVGAAGGVISVASAGSVLREAEGLLTAATAITATLAVALLVGMWAGAPAMDEDELPYSERWVAASIAAAVAGAFASFLTIYGPLGNQPLARIVTLLALLAAPIYTLGMLIPVLLAWGERLLEGEETSDGAWGVVGGLSGGLLGGFAIGAAAAGLVLLTWLGGGPLLLAVSVLLLVPVLVPDPTGSGSRERLLAEIHSDLSEIRVTELVFPGERQPERRLYLGDEQESGELVRSGAPTLAYIAAAEAWLTLVTPPGATYLFLGGGAYTLPRRVAERDGRAEIVVVELDPEITRLAYRFFGVRRDHGIRTIHGDARAVLEGEAVQGVDRLYMDVYGGGEALPHSLVTVEAFQAARRALAPDGMLGINVIGMAAEPHGRRTWAVVRTLAEVFPGVAIYTHHGPEYPDNQNFLLVAHSGEAELPSRAGQFERWERSSWPDLATRSVLRDVASSPDRETTPG